MSCAATPKIGYIVMVQSGIPDNLPSGLKNSMILLILIFKTSSNLVGIWREMKKSRVQLDPILGLISGMIWVIAQKPKIT